MDTDELAILRADAARFAWYYSRTQTTSNALINIELRRLNGETPTLDEVRDAYDECMNSPITSEIAS